MPRLSPTQRADELLRINAVLEGFAAIDEDDGNFFPVEFQQIRPGCDIYLVQGKRMTGLKRLQECFCFVAEVAIGLAQYLHCRENDFGHSCCLTIGNGFRRGVHAASARRQKQRIIAQKQ